MKRFLFSFAILAIVCANAQLLSAEERAHPHKVALIDMGYVFKNYRKFDAMTAALRSQVEQIDTASRARMEQMQQIQAQLESGALKPGSPEHKKLETQLVELQATLQSERQVAERDLLRKEADIYKTIYLEVQDAIRLYAEHYEYTLVVRFTRPDFDEASGPREILEQVNNTVVYFLPQDDLSESVVGYLNDNWQKHQPSVSPANGTSAP